MLLHFFVNRMVKILITLPRKYFLSSLLAISSSNRSKIGWKISLILTPILSVSPSLSSHSSTNVLILWIISFIIVFLVLSTAFYFFRFFVFIYSLFISDSIFDVFYLFFTLLTYFVFSLILFCRLDLNWKKWQMFSEKIDLCLILHEFSTPLLN